MFYNTQQLLDALTGENKAYVSQIAKRQLGQGCANGLKAYAYREDVTIHVGKKYAKFYIKKGKIIDAMGTATAKLKALEAVALELSKQQKPDSGYHEDGLTMSQLSKGIDWKHAFKPGDFEKIAAILPD